MRARRKRREVLARGNSAAARLRRIIRKSGVGSACAVVGMCSRQLSTWTTYSRLPSAGLARTGTFNRFAVRATDSRPASTSGPLVRRYQGSSYRCAHHVPAAPPAVVTRATSHPGMRWTVKCSPPQRSSKCGGCVLLSSLRVIATVRSPLAGLRSAWFACPLAPVARRCVTSVEERAQRHDVTWGVRSASTLCSEKR